VLLTGQRASSKKLEDAGFGFSYADLVPALEELIGPK
jgi:NAD dependent epimerase/dehydratase family enzyme